MYPLTKNVFLAYHMEKAEVVWQWMEDWYGSPEELAKVLDLALEMLFYLEEDTFDRKEVQRMDPFSCYATIAALQAIEDAKLDIAKEKSHDRISVILGVACGGVQSFEKNSSKLLQRGPTGVEPLFIPKFMGNGAAGQIAIKTGATGPCFTVASACTSATDAIGRALMTNPSLLILDEATSSLDQSTEKKIIESIQLLKRKKTLIIVTHRLFTVKNCDKIFFIDKGKITKQGSPEKILNNMQL